MTSIGYPDYLSHHALTRCNQRGISPQDLSVVQRFGRVQHERGACTQRLGRRELQRAQKALKRDLSKLAGLELVWNTDETMVITVYRNAGRGSSALWRAAQRYA
jgi:hypothetical protein